MFSEYSSQPLESSLPPSPTAATAEKRGEDSVEEAGEVDGRGTWKHAAFHVATTIATPAAYAPLPFALASLGWPLGQFYLIPLFIPSVFGSQENLLSNRKLLYSTELSS